MPASDLPLAMAQVATPVSGVAFQFGRAIPLTPVPVGALGRRQSIQDSVRYWETYQMLGPNDKVDASAVGPLGEAATFEQVLAGWEFRGKAGRGASLEEVMNYAVNRWRKVSKQQSRKVLKKKFHRRSTAPYPTSKNLAHRMKKSMREKATRQKINARFEALAHAVAPNYPKIEKISLLTKAMELIGQLREENVALRRDCMAINQQCSAVSQCLRSRIASAAAAKAQARSRPTLVTSAQFSQNHPSLPYLFDIKDRGRATHQQHQQHQQREGDPPSFRRIFDTVLSSLPNAESDDDLIKPSAHQW